MRPGDRPMQKGQAGPFAVDYIVVAYVLASGLLIAAVGGERGLWVAALHFAVAGLLYRLARLAVPRQRVLAFLRLFYPIAITPVFYGELGWLNQLVFHGYFDVTVQGWEQALFGAQLSVAFARALPYRSLSEILHLGYLSYYFIMPVAAAGALVAGGPRAAHRVTVTVALAFYVCYLCFAVFPVAGPRYEFPAPGGALADGLVYQLVHRVLESGSSRGTAFPSSHVAVSVSAWLAMWPDSRRLFIGLAPFVILLALGTVYGGFHYGIDSVTGVVVALVFVSAARPLVRWLGAPSAA